MCNMKWKLKFEDYKQCLKTNQLENKIDLMWKAFEKNHKECVRKNTMMLKL